MHTIWSRHSACSVAISLSLSLTQFLGPDRSNNAAAAAALSCHSSREQEETEDLGLAQDRTRTWMHLQQKRMYNKDITVHLLITASRSPQTATHDLTSCSWRPWIRRRGPASSLLLLLLLLHELLFRWWVVSNFLSSSLVRLWSLNNAAAAAADHQKLPPRRSFLPAHTWWACDLRLQDKQSKAR